MYLERNKLLKNMVTKVVLSIFWFEDSKVEWEQVNGDNSYNNILIFIKVFTKFLDNLFSSSYFSPHIYFYQDEPSDWYHSLTYISTKISHQIDITHSHIFLPRWAIILISLTRIYFYQDKPSDWYHLLTYISTKISHQIDITHSLIFLPG